MQFKDFEIRPVKSLDGVIDPNRFELVKWYDHEPTPVTNMRTGEKRISTRSCFVVAWLEWNDKEPCFELVKWYDHKPYIHGESTSTRSCFVVAWLERNDKELCFELKSVGLRLVENWVDGLDQFIIKWCEMAEVCMEDNE